MNPSDPIVRAGLLLDRAVADCRPALEAAGYVPNQPDDIGRLLWLLLAAGMVRLTEESRAERLDELTDSLRERRVGSRRPRRHARPLVQLIGAEGVALPAGVTAQSAGGGRRAVLARRPLVLARLGAAVWFDGRGVACPLSGAGEDAGPVELTPVPYADVHGLSLPLIWGPAPAGTTPAGLLWDVPAAIGGRVTSVVVHRGASRRTVIPVWTPTGQVFIPLGRVGGGLPDRVEIGVRLAPAQLRHAGRVLPNVTVARELAPPEYDGAAPAGDGPIDTLTHAAGADVGVTEVTGGWPARRGESVAAWRRRADVAFRHGGRAVTRSDYADLVAARFPELRVLQVEPCRVGPAARRADGVRVVIVPRRWASAYDLLNRAAAAAPRVAQLLQPRAVVGVQVDVGPPAVAVSDPPPLSDPLSVYGEFLAVGSGAARRPDHPGWPTYRLDELRQAAQEGE